MDNITFETMESIIPNAYANAQQANNWTNQASVSGVQDEHRGNVRGVEENVQDEAEDPSESRTTSKGKTRVRFRDKQKSFLIRTMYDRFRGVRSAQVPWGELTEELNKLGPRKTPRGWKETWRALLFNTKRSMSRRKKCLMPAEPEVHRMLLEMIGIEPGEVSENESQVSDIPEDPDDVDVEATDAAEGSANDRRGTNASAGCETAPSDAATNIPGSSDEVSCLLDVDLLSQFSDDVVKSFQAQRGAYQKALARVEQQHKHHLQQLQRQHHLQIRQLQEEHQTQQRQTQQRVQTQMRHMQELHSVDMQQMQGCWATAWRQAEERWRTERQRQVAVQEEHQDAVAKALLQLVEAQEDMQHDNEKLHQRLRGTVGRMVRQGRTAPGTMDADIDNLSDCSTETAESMADPGTSTDTAANSAASSPIITDL